MSQIPRARPSRRKPPLTPQEVAETIRWVLNGDGSLIPSRHFRERGQQRDFTVQDALLILEHGTVFPAPQWNERMEDWTYDIRDMDAEGEPLTVRIGISPDRRVMILVTAFA